MGILASDNFTRSNSLTTLGTSDTGQVWQQHTGHWGILSNNAVRFANTPFLNAYATLECYSMNVSMEATLVNVSAFNGRFGIVARYVSTSARAIYWYDTNFPEMRLNVNNGTNGSDASSAIMTLNDGDVIRLDCCGHVYTGYVNGVQVLSLTFGYADPAGTQHGLYAQDTIFIGGDGQRWDNFQVSSIADCPASTWNCTNGRCIDPGDGTGTYLTLELCEAGCVAESYNCVDGVCIDPGTGMGTYATLAECQSSGCGGSITDSIETVRFDAGIGSSWYVALPVIDSGDDLRSKVLKTMRVTGKLTNASAQLYGYDVNDGIDVTDIEAGVNSDAGASLTDSTQVAQSERHPINVPNTVLHTVRVDGDDTGNDTRDEVHEIVVEQASQGVRR